MFEFGFVSIKIFWTASSIGSVILQAGDKRLLAPNSEVMIHLGSSALPTNHPKENMNTLKQAEKFDLRMREMYLSKVREKKPDFTKKQLEDWLNFAKYFSPSEAIEFGLADGTIETHSKK